MPSASRRLAVFALALLLSAVPRAQQAQVPEPRFRGGTNQVRLDVYATKDGVAVTDLTAADFEVLEDNAPQTVSSFELVKARGVVPDSARVEPNTVAESRERAAQPDARLFVLFLDTLHVQVEGSYRAQNPVAALLDRVVGEDDLVGVMTPEITARNIAFSPRTSSVGRMLAANWTWGERGAINTRDPRDREIEQCYPDIAPTVGFAKAIIGRRREQRLLDSLEDLIQHLEGLREERSFVLLLSEGWLMPEPDRVLGLPITWPSGQRTVPGGPDDLGVTPDGKLTTRAGQGDRSFESCERERGLLANQDFAMSFQQLMRRANRANVSFYPIDPRGLVVFDEPIGRRGGDGPVADSMRLGQRQNTLRQLAEETDGAVVLNTNIEKALPRLLNDVGSYYLLGYVSTNQKLDGRYRKLTVRVKRPGVELRSRPGYLAPSAAEVTAAQTPPKTKSAPTSVGQALSLLPTGRRLAPIYVQATGGAGYVQVTLEVDRVTAALPEWAKGGQVRVEIEPADGSGGAARRTDTVMLEAGARVVTSQPPEGDPLPPGTYQVRVQATPGGEGARAPVTASATVTVPKPAALLGSAALASRRTGRIVSATADPRFRRTERLILETPIVGTAPAITARLLNREGQVMAVPVTVTERVAAESHARLSVADVALAPLAPGDYVIEIVAVAGSATETVSYALRIVP